MYNVSVFLSHLDSGVDLRCFLAHYILHGSQNASYMTLYLIFFLCFFFFCIVIQSVTQEP